MGLFDRAPQTNNFVASPPATVAPQMDDIDDLIANSKPSVSSVYPDPGLYPVLYVDVFKVVLSHQGDKLFTAEFLILDSQVATRPAGTKMTWQGNLRHYAVPGNIKTLIAATMGVDPQVVDNQAIALEF